MPEYRKGHEPANKGRKFPPEPLNSREVLGLVAACGKGAAGRRNRALIVLLWRTGLRVGEALALYPKDVDLDAGTVRVLHGKGDASRTVGIDQMACATVNDWLTCRRKLGAHSRQPIFCVISKPTIGQPMHAAYVRNMLKETGERAGIEKRVHPHGLRHTHAFELAGEHEDLRIIKAQLGHKSLSVTARYIEHLNPHDVVDAIRSRPWPGASELGGARDPRSSPLRQGPGAEVDAVPGLRSRHRASSG
jgi:site-specific recombinase XerD